MCVSTQELQLQSAELLSRKEELDKRRRQVAKESRKAQQQLARAADATAEGPADFDELQVSACVRGTYTHAHACTLE
jgi:hypothetical protein